MNLSAEAVAALGVDPKTVTPVGQAGQARIDQNPGGTPCVREVQALFRA